MRTAGSGHYCRYCGYNVAGMPAGPCPECSTPFDPENPRTLAIAGDVTAASLLPIAAPVLLICSIALAAALMWLMSPVLGTGGGPLVALAFAIPGIVWIVLLYKFTVEPKAVRTRLRTPARILNLTPFVLLGTFVLIVVGAPQELRWRIEEPGVAAFANAALAAPTPPGGLTAPPSVFGYRCTNVTVATHGVRFALADAPSVWFDFGHEIVYAPAGPPSDESSRTFRHLRGPWYLTFYVD